MPPQDPEASHWFAENLQPHEAMLRAWLSNRFSSGCDVDDIVQEAFVRVLEARQSTEIVAPKAFLFATARNLALARFRQKQIIGEIPLTENDLFAILDESVDVPEAVQRSQELELLTLAIQSLPTRCRQVLTLRKIYGMSQRDVATQLGISENTVEAQGTIGLRKISDFFARHEHRGL